MAELPTWLIAVIVASGTIVLVLFVCCLWMCCCRRKGDKTFRWIDRLGIPFANEGEPSQVDLSREMKVRVNIDVNATNKAYEDEEEKVSDGTLNDQRQRAQTEAEEYEPFKRLDQLGIPRAQRGNTPVSGRRIPNAPLPSPGLDDGSESSSDDEISIRS